MADLILGSTTAMTESGGALTLGTISGGTLGSGVTYPAGMIIKTYQKCFKARQSYTTACASPPVDGDYILVGTGANGGTEGDPLRLTTDVPKNSSSKYLITCQVHQCRNQNGSIGFMLMYDVSGTPTRMVTGTPTGANYMDCTFGKGHMSTTGGTGFYGTHQTGIMYLWSPGSASAQTIQIGGANYNTSANYINSPTNTDNGPYMVRVISTLTVQEIAG